MDIKLQEYKIPITHYRLTRIGWQLRLASPTVYTDAHLEFVLVSREDFMAKPPLHELAVGHVGVELGHI